MKKCPLNMQLRCLSFMVSYHLERKDDAMYLRNLFFLCSIATRMLSEVYIKESLNFAGIALLLKRDFAAAERHFAGASAQFPQDNILRSNLEAARKHDISKIAVEKY